MLALGQVSYAAAQVAGGQAHGFAKDFHLSGRGMQQAQDEAQGSALAGSVGPYQTEDGPFGNLEADAVGRYPAPLEYLG